MRFQRDNYIPDITERYPEGFNSPIDSSYNGYEPSYDELRDEYDVKTETTEIETVEENHPQTLFEVGDEFVKYGIYGGITLYTVCRITKDRKRLCTTERWSDVDGNGKRKPSWHEVVTDEYGEKFREFEGYDSWIRSKYKGGVV